MMASGKGTRGKNPRRPRKKKENSESGGARAIVEPVEVIDAGSESETARTEEVDGTAPARDAGRTSSDKPAIYDPVAAYYQDVRHYPILSREEERETAIRYLDTGDIEAAYRLVTSNLRLVIKIAMEYRRLWKEIVDLIQEGNVGLMTAVKKYDPYRGVRFSSYAAWWIRAYIIRYIMNNTRMVKLGTTQAQRTLYFQMGKERERLRKLGIEPDSRALAKSLNVKESEVDEMAQRLSGSDLSLEASMGGEDETFTLLDALPAQQPGVDDVVADAQARSIYLEKLSEYVAGLSDRDKKIFTSRWMRDDPMTLQELGDKLGITRERVRQLEARILSNLREFLEEEGLSAADFLR